MTEANEVIRLRQALGSGQALSFAIGGAEYALPIASLREIAEIRAVDPADEAVLPLRGTIDLRGSTVPVLDLGHALGHGETALGGQSCVLVLEVALDGRPALLGVLADDVRDLVDLAPDDVLPPPPLGPHRVRQLLGVARRAEGLVLLVDPSRLLTPADEAVAARLHRVALDA